MAAADDAVGHFSTSLRTSRGEKQPQEKITRQPFKDGSGERARRRSSLSIALYVG